MKNYFASFFVGAVCLLSLSCGDKEPPVSEVEKVLSEAFAHRDLKATLENVKVEKLDGADKEYSWKADFVSKGEYYERVSEDELFEKYELTSLVEELKAERVYIPRSQNIGLFVQESELPAIPNSVYKKYKGEVATVEIYGKVEAELLVDKWSIQISDLQEDSLDDLSKLNKLKEKGNLPKDAVILGGAETDDFASNFKASAQKEFDKIAQRKIEVAKREQEKKDMLAKREAEKLEKKEEVVEARSALIKLIEEGAELKSDANVSTGREKLGIKFLSFTPLAYEFDAATMTEKNKVKLGEYECEISIGGAEVNYTGDVHYLSYSKELVWELGFKLNDRANKVAIKYDGEKFSSFKAKNITISQRR